MVRTYYAEPLFDVKNALGEGPLWHPTENCFYWTDIISGDLFRTNAELSSFIKMHISHQIGAFAFCRAGGLILATDQGFMELAINQKEPTHIWNPLPNQKEVRLNDGKVDPAGRFWAGSMDTENSQGALYRLDPDGSQHVMLTGIGISNGLGWSPDHIKMYYTDSMQYTVFAYDYDLETGSIKNGQPLIRLPKDSHEIVPDGLCVDAEGYIWSAQWNGWQIVRYDPEGKPIAIVKVPVQRVTSCTFGGENLDILLITTSRVDLSDEDLAHQPMAGDVFTCHVDVQGQMTNLFG